MHIASHKCFAYMIFFLIIVVKTRFLVPVTSVRVQMCLFLGMLVSVQKANEWVEEGLYIGLCVFFYGKDAVFHFLTMTRCLSAAFQSPHQIDLPECLLY